MVVSGILAAPQCQSYFERRASKAKGERARTRQRKFGESLKKGMGVKTILETHSVRNATQKDYASKLEKFQRLQAAIEYHRPEAAREGQLQLPRFRRALKGWRRLSPTQTRLPMIEFVKSSISGIFIHAGHAEKALFNELSFSTYGRPEELLKLKAADYVGKNRNFEHSVLVLAPVERGETTKARIYDEALARPADEGKFREPTCGASMQLPTWQLGGRNLPGC